MTADDCFRRFALDAEALRSSRDEDGTDLAPLPAWAGAAFTSVTRTADELSISSS
jgi:hypothetical protein